MKNLPTKFGSLTLVRKLGESSTAETYEGFQEEGERGRVLVRRVLPALLADPAGRQAIETRIRDLMGVRHPFLVPIIDLLTPSGECLMVEQWVEALPFSTVIEWCRARGVGVPHNVFLNLSTQICNGLEALHGRPGKVSGNPNVLHMALRPSTLFVNLDGRILLGGYGLTRTPALPASEADTDVHPDWVSHLAPEQTEPDQKLIPASDIFGLATILFELLTLQSLFEADTALQTLHRLRRAEITTQLLGVKDVMPGLDKVLYRALSSSPRHRYQRAFVLREDLRGLMAGYSFATITDDTRRFLEPIVQAHPFPAPTPVQQAPQGEPAPGPVDGFDDKVSTRIDPDPRSTAAYASQALAERAAREHKQGAGAAPQAAAPQPVPMPTSFPPPREPAVQPASTAAYIAQAQGQPLAESGPTLAPPEEQAPPAQSAAQPVPAAAPTRELPPITPPPVQAQSPAVAAPLAQKPQPAAAPASSSRSAALAAAAPPPGRSPEQPAPAPVAASPSPGQVSPPPQVSDTAGAPIHAGPPPVQDYEEDTGDWEPPKKRGATMFMLMLVGLVLVLVCSGGLWAAWNYFGAAWYASRSNLAELEIDIPDVTEFQPDDQQLPLEAPSLDGVAEAAPDPGDQTEPTEDPEDEPPEPEAELEPAATATDSSARDQPAYQGSSSTSPSTTSRSSSSGSSSRSSSGSSSRSSSPSTGSGSSGSSSRSSYSSGSSSRSSSPSTSSSSSGSSSRSSYSSGGSSSSSSYGSSYQAEPVSYDDGMAELSSDSPESDPDDSNSLLERYSAQAATGSLGSSDIMVIEMVQPEDSAFTRSRLMLVMNSKSKGDAAGVKRYLDELSMRPENQYNPVVLAEYARYYVNKKDYQRALDKAVLAERHWARLPPELVFTKKAEIYEVEAASYQGLFYKSEDNVDLLEKSIRQWKKYREHVMTESRTDLQARANREIEKLENIRERLQ